MPELPRLPWRAVAASTVLALLAATATYVVLSDGDDEPAAEVTDLEPDVPVEGAVDADFTTFDDQVVPLRSLRGIPTVVNFFASTCVPCIDEMPDLEDAYQSVGTEVQFLGLAVNDRPDEAQALVERTGVTYPTAQDPDQAVLAAVGGSVLPTTVVLDADGRIVAHKYGALAAGELQEMLADALGIGA